MAGSDIIMVKTVCGSKAESLKIAEQLLDKRLTACASILGPMESIFRWKGNVETAREFLLILKTQEKHVEKITAEIVKLHSYDLPEVIAVPVKTGLSDYINWVIEET